MSRASEQRLPPNPYDVERSPYPDEPERRSSAHTTKLGPNMFDQQGQSSRGSTRQPFPESWGEGGELEDRHRRPAGYKVGDGSGGYNDGP